jgi:dethiobiotin synthetase
MPSAKLCFITGTDTGVGKTVLTSLLLCHLRTSGLHALAFKPFCSGSRKDVALLNSVQRHELTLDEMNPFYFPEPVAPLVAARKHHRPLEVGTILKHIRNIASRCEWLLIEGAGGLLVPIANGLTFLDLLARLDCRVIVVARNKLGTINHTLLTVDALSRNTALERKKRTSRTVSVGEQCRVVLMDHAARDHSSASNASVLAEFLSPVPLFTIPFLGRNNSSVAGIEKKQKKLQKTLARILQ